MDSDLICNNRRCRKRITSLAWVTSCSHIFCNEDGSHAFTHDQTCPACSNQLTGRLDAVRIDLCPTEEYKSMILAGQKPEVVLEICSRAVSFWNYQVQNEIQYQMHQATKYKEKLSIQSQSYDKIIESVKLELNISKNQLKNAKEELENVKTKIHEMNEKMGEKTRQYQKLLSMFESLKRKTINVSSGLENEPPTSGRRTPNDIPTFGLAFAEDILRNPRNSFDISDVHSEIYPATQPFNGFSNQSFHGERNHGKRHSSKKH